MNNLQMQHNRMQMKRGREHMNIKVGEQDKQIVIVAYDQRCDQGWEAVLKRVQEKIE